MMSFRLKNCTSYILYVEVVYLDDIIIYSRPLVEHICEKWEVPICPSGSCISWPDCWRRICADGSGGNTVHS